MLTETGTRRYRGIDFWTQNQTVTSLWKQEDALNSRADVSMPTMR